MAKRKTKKQKRNDILVILICVAVIAALAIFALNEKGLITIRLPAKPSDTVTVEAGESSVHFINVGQGDSELIVATDGTTMLIDSGEAEYGPVVLSYLEELGIDRLDYIIATHPHSDHMGGLASVISSDIEIGKIYMPEIAAEHVPTTKTYERFLLAVANRGARLYKGENLEFDFGDGRIKMYISDYKEDNLNNYSILIKYDIGEHSFLFTGDIEALAEKYYVNNSYDLDADVLKVCHHGSSTSSTYEFLNAVTPDFCVIECGDNGFNHPNSQVVMRLLEYTENIYRTDIQGTVVFVTDGTDLEFTYEDLN